MRDIPQPLQVFKIWQGGMSFHGGLLGVVFAAWWWSRKPRLHLFDTVDFIAPLVPPGLGFGRLGNYINGDLYSREGAPSTSSPEFPGYVSLWDQMLYKDFPSGGSGTVASATDTRCSASAHLRPS